jgi:hypothetical protein
MRELQKSGKKAEVKVVEKQELWGMGFDRKLQIIRNWRKRLAHHYR